MKNLIYTSLLLLLLYGAISSVNGQSNASYFRPPILNGGVGASTGLPDGKIIIAGGFTTVNGVSSPCLARLNPDGTRDATFTTQQSCSFLLKAIVQPDGKILVAGASGVARFNVNGTVDSSFVPPSISNIVFDMVLQSNGKIIISGIFYVVGGQTYRTIARLNSNGTLDDTYLNTYLNTNTNIGGFGPDAIDVQSDGKIIIAGNYGQNKGLLRLNTDGSLDTSFNPNAGENYIRQLKVLPNDKILASNSVYAINGEFTSKKLTRLNTDGTIDSSFNTGSGDDGIIYFIIQQNGKIVANTNGFVKRFNTNGSLDNSFNTLNVTGELVRGFGIQQDDKVLISGQRSTPQGVQNYINRLNSNGSLDNGNIQLDFDGDGKSDNVVFRPGNGIWYLNNSTSGFSAVGFGASSDIPMAADFDGDGKADISVFRPSTGSWYRLNSSNGAFTAVQFGADGDLPTAADYDGDGKADVSVFRPSNGVWYRLNSTDGSFFASAFGTNGDKPVPQDFDGDGKADLAVYRPSVGTWYINGSTQGVSAVQFGSAEDKPTAADFDGDGKADISVFRPSNGTWYRLNSSNGQFSATSFGTNGDLPVAADYDGDGKADISIFRPSNGVWYRLNSLNGQFAAVAFGANGDFPVQSIFAR
ncbi:MAG TPA: FG-GAP-like repeat-containing protein [Pyrinomonadaceae bacterium]|nr:FG-GAP-like repeat-containing protein [Pyrinomonadaceae bacterium]